MSRLNNRYDRLFIASLVLFLAIPSVRAQQAPRRVEPVVAPVDTRLDKEQAEGFTMRVTVNLVQVDAVVTDKSGRIVPDLGADDFEVLQDGRRQKITHFSFVQSSAPAPSPLKKTTTSPDLPFPPARLRPEQVKRTVAIVVDDLGLSFESGVFVREAVKKFVAQQIQPGDLVAILRTSAGMGALQQFTTDKRMLLAAAERIRWSPFGRGAIGTFAPIETDIRFERRLLGGRGQENRAPEARWSDTDELDPSRLTRFRDSYFAVGTLGALDYVVRGLRQLPGRKSVILFTDSVVLFHKGEPNDQVLEALKRLTDLASRAGVVIYPIDARGLVVGGIDAADDVNPLQVAQVLQERREQLEESKQGMFYLAEETGGLFIHNNNDLNLGIRRVLEDQAGYYLIGYAPQAGTFDERTGRRLFHKIEVKVNKQGLRVRSRKGFFGIADSEAAPAPSTRNQQLHRAITSPFHSGDVRVRLTALFHYEPKRGPLLGALLHIDTRDLSFERQEDGSYKTLIDLLAITFGENGIPVDYSDRQYLVTVKPGELEAALKQGIAYSMLHPVKKPGPYQMRVAVRDATSQKVGSASQFVEVPDLGKHKLALSGIVMRASLDERAEAAPRSGARDGGTSEGAQKPASAAALAEGGIHDPDLRGTPALRIFTAGRKAYYGAQVFNAKADKQTKTPRLDYQVRVIHEGQVILPGKRQPLSPNSTNQAKDTVAVGMLNFGSGLEAGEYLLQMLVYDNLAKEKDRLATQWISFEVAPAQ